MRSTSNSSHTSGGVGAPRRFSHGRDATLQSSDDEDEAKQMLSSIRHLDASERKRVLAEVAEYFPKLAKEIDELRAEKPPVSPKR
jgi:hypothetical protein